MFTVQLKLLFQFSNRLGYLMKVFKVNGPFQQHFAHHENQSSVARGML